MVAIKAHQANAFLKSPSATCRAVLLYGTDSGQVSERARELAARWAGSETPPGEVVRIDEPDLEQDPERLVVELQTMPMFGGPPIVRTTLGRRLKAVDVAALLEGDRMSGRLVVEAGNLKPDDAFRALFEKSPSAAAVACYGDSMQDLGGLVQEVLGAHGARISPEARQLLLSRLGADHALSRGEIEKLALFAHGKPVIEIEDVEDVVGDAAELAVDRVVSATVAGEMGRALVELDRVVASGEGPQTIIVILQSHFLRLHRVRAAMAGGKSLDEAVRGLRPPVHFKQKAAFEAACRRWSEPRLAAALTRIARAAHAARRTSALDGLLTERLIAELARLAASAEERPPRR